MLVTLSSKGQLVIPKNVRTNLALAPGDHLRLRVVDGTIILERVEAASLIDALYGKYAADDMLTELEQEHQQEVRADESRT